jgi:inorganic pyrophosphatase
MSITAGNIPDEINVIIEIAMNSHPIKYEVDKESGLVAVDRFLNVAMNYPCNYGYVPNTHAGDGDPLDVLMICQYPVMPSALIKGRPIGVLMMEDESGIDEKIIALPTLKADPFYADIKDIADLSGIIKERIKHFFEHYKDLEKNKWVKVGDWHDAKRAKELILQYVIK